MKIYTLILTLLLTIAPCCFADGTRLISNTVISYDLPGEHWQVSQDAPPLAIDAMYADLVHGKEDKGESYEPEKLRATAEKLLKTNNLYIFNPDTEAYLMVSISPYMEENGKPDKKSVKASADWAAKAVTEHAEVDDLAPYSTSIAMVEIPGVKYAAKVESDYPLFGEPHNFIGIIGYSHPYWVFLYYNDKAKRDADLTEMKNLLASLKFENM